MSDDSVGNLEENHFTAKRFDHLGTSVHGSNKAAVDRTGMLKVVGQAI